MASCSYWHLLGDAAAGAAGAAAAGAAGGDEGGTSPEFVRSSSEERHDSGTTRKRRRELPRKTFARAVPKRLYCARRAWFQASEWVRDTEAAVELMRSQMAGARAADICAARKAARSFGRSAAGPTAPPDAAAGAAVEGDSDDEVAARVSGVRAGSSADAPRPWQDPAARRRDGQGPKRCRAKGPEGGGHGCPQSADPLRTERNRREKARKAAAQERYFAGLLTKSEAAQRQDAWERSLERFQRYHMRELRQARRSRSSRVAAGAAAEERRGQN